MDDRHKTSRAYASCSHKNGLKLERYKQTKEVFLNSKIDQLFYFHKTIRNVSKNLIDSELLKF